MYILHHEFFCHNYLFFNTLSSVEQEVDESEESQKATTSTAIGEVMVLIMIHHVVMFIVHVYNVEGVGESSIKLHLS